MRTAYRAARSVGRHIWLAVILLTVIGAALRVWRLNGQSAWAPEVVSAYVATLSPGKMLFWLIGDHKHYLDAPSYYFLLHWWFNQFGAGVVQARILSLCFSILTIPATYLLARLVTARSTALLATLILAVSQTGVLYAQEACPYSQFVFFVVITCYLFLRALRERRAGLWWVSAAAAILMCFSHPYGLFVLAVLVGYAWTRRGTYRIPWPRWVGAAIFFAVPVAAWVATISRMLPITAERLFRASRDQMGSPIGWDHLPGEIGWFNGMKWFGLESSARLGPFVFTALVFTVPALYGAWRLFQRQASGTRPEEQRQTSLLLAALWILPLVAIVGLGTLGYNKYLDFEIQIRYGILCAVPYYILVATGIREIPSAWLRGTVLALLLVSSALALRAVYYIPYKADYRDGVKTIAAGYREGDCVLFYPLINQLPLLGHRPGPPPYWYIYSGNKPDIRVGNIGDIASGRSTCSRVWFLWDHTPWVDHSDQGEKAKEVLDGTRVRTREQTYFLTEVGLYDAKMHLAGPPLSGGGVR